MAGSAPTIPGFRMRQLIVNIEFLPLNLWQGGEEEGGCRNGGELALCTG
jgi:hypothetical protein